MAKPFSPACENNKAPILAILERHLADIDHVLEIGSGTGQHAVYFAEHLPHLTWQTSDLPENHPGIRAWIADARLPNVEPPLALDVTAPTWPCRQTPAVFSANTAHIMSEREVEHMIRGVARTLTRPGLFCLYGPFSYQGAHTSPGNIRFDRSLRARDPSMGIRDVEFVDRIASDAGLTRVEDNPMPANNRLLVWRADGP